MSKTLLLAISAHGLGHLGQTVPLLTALRGADPSLKILLFSSLPADVVQTFIPDGVEYVAAPEHVTIAMHGPLRVDLGETKARFTRWHSRYAEHCQSYCDILSELKPDLVISNVDYTVLSAARKLGIPAFGMCSLNWADIMRPMMDNDAGMLEICDEITSVYRQTERFIRVTPGMDMTALDNRVCVGPLARSGRKHSLHHTLGLPGNTQMLMFSLGGIDQELDIAHWTLPENTHCIVPDHIEATAAGFTRISETGLSYIDALASVDVLLTKPGYGNFCEAWKNNTSVIYLRRDYWPEESALLEWIHKQCPAVEMAPTDFVDGNLCRALSELSALTVPFAHSDGGEQEIVTLLRPYLN